MTTDTDASSEHDDEIETAMSDTEYAPDDRMPRKTETGKGARVKKVTSAPAMTIALLGRPNVGKSTLFNRLAGRSLALVHASPGVTRDRRIHEASLFDMRFNIIDTAGLDEVDGFLYGNEIGVPKPKASRVAPAYTPSQDEIADAIGANLTYNKTPLSSQLRGEMLEQTQLALQMADLVLFMIDAREGITPADHYFGQWLRKNLQHGNFAKRLTEPRTSSSSTVQSGTTKQNHVTGDWHEVDPEAYGIHDAPVLLVANKCEPDGSESVESGLYETYELGLGEPVAISAQHGDGMHDLHAAVSTMVHRYGLERKLEADKDTYVSDSEVPLQEVDEAEHFVEPDASTLQVAFVGKPNVGKSTLINGMVGESRVLTGDQPGVTRDPIAVPWKDVRHEDFDFRLIDTAGLKGTSTVARSMFAKVDSLAMEASLNAIEYAHVVVLVVDVAEGLDPNYEQNIMTRTRWSRRERDEAHTQLVRNVFAHDDLAIAKKVIDEGRAMVVVANKWDLVPSQMRGDVKHAMDMYLREKVHAVRAIPVVRMCALDSKMAANRVSTHVIKVFKQWDQRVSTGHLNRWLQEFQRFSPAPTISGRPISLKFITQTSRRPPTFCIFSSHADKIPENYSRRIRNAICDEFQLEDVPVRVYFRQRENPYVNGSRVPKAKAGKKKLGKKLTKVVKAPKTSKRRMKARR
jgi:GTPase